MTASLSTTNPESSPHTATAMSVPRFRAFTAVRVLMETGFFRP